MKVSDFGFTLIEDESTGDNNNFAGLIVERVHGPVRCYNPYRGMYEELDPARFDIFMVSAGKREHRRTPTIEPWSEDKRHYTRRDNTVVEPPSAADLREYRRKIAAYLFEHKTADFQTICSGLKLASQSLARTALRGHQFEQTPDGKWRIATLTKAKKLVEEGAAQ